MPETSWHGYVLSRQAKLVYGAIGRLFRPSPGIGDQIIAAMGVLWSASDFRDQPALDE
jgi:hypothetical protein